MSSAFQTAIRHELEAACRLLETFINDDLNIQHIEAAALMMAAAIGAGGKIMSCGNGGSHCDAMHFAEELTGRYRSSRRPIAAIAISDPSYMSCVGNDFGFDKVFSRYIEALGKAGDVLLAISSSGNAANIIQAVAAAREREMNVVLLLGNEGGALRGRGDIEIIVPYVGFADRIQEIHIKVIHTVIHCLETLLEDKYGF